MKGLFYLDTFSISDHHSPENFHSREAIDIGVVRSFLQPTFSLGTNTSCQYWPNIRSAYYARDCGEIWGKYVKNYPTKYMNLFEEDSTKDSAWQGHLRGAYGNTCPMFSQLFGPPKTQKGKCKLDGFSFKKFSIKWPSSLTRFQWGTFIGFCQIPKVGHFKQCDFRRVRNSEWNQTPFLRSSIPKQLAFFQDGVVW